MDVALKISDLVFGYSEKPDLLKKVSFQLNKGEKAGIIGPNGAGKTTLFHLICGLLKPDSGRIFTYERKVKTNSFNPDVGYIFQNPDSQLFNTSVYDDIAFGPINMGLGKDEVNSRVEKALKITHMEKLAERAPHHLSAGEKRMVAIATILSMEPRIMIYDEPSSNLDMRTRRTLINFLNASRETKLISSHDMEFILETCSRVIILDEGSIVADGDPREIMNNEALMHRHGMERPHSLLHLQKNHIHS
jgi:cobalt/nickel transport system ATP-binding protein